MKRITPAHAGKSSLMIKEYRLKKDHPRTRGEKLDGTDYHNIYEGSPPHTRGKDLLYYQMRD